jgi:1,2-diacylglycerol-3-alpha-glucose alpha-1,2-galactosyltransferase
MKKIRVNMVSESDISVQGHGVHTAYDELARAMEKRDDVELIRGEFGKTIDCDIVHIHTIGSHTWRKLFQKGPKKVISAHVVPDSFVGSLALARLWRFLACWYMKWYYNKGDLLLAMSNETKKDLLDIGVTQPIVVEHNSIDILRYKQDAKASRAIRKKLGIAQDTFVVIGAGQVQPRKRVDSFVSAARALPDVHFIWVGGMPFGKLAAKSAQMTKLIQEAPENVSFPGIISLEDMPAYYHAADLFWLPSDQETFGLVVVEAAAAGLPVMLRDLSDYDDTFGHDALRVDEAGFVPAIQKLQSDAKTYDKWRRNSYKIAKRFDSSSVAERLVKLYRGLV